MRNKTARELAKIIGMPLERLLEQLAEAGLQINSPDENICDEDQYKLLAHLRKCNSKTEHKTDANAPTRVPLKRIKVSELKKNLVQGSSAKIIKVEVRKKENQISHIIQPINIENSSPEEREIELYIAFYKYNNFKEHHEVNKFITKYNLWDLFKTIRAYNDHGSHKNMPEINPKAFRKVCLLLNISGGNGTPVTKSVPY